MFVQSILAPALIAALGAHAAAVVPVNEAAAKLVERASTASPAAAAAASSLAPAPPVTNPKVPVANAAQVPASSKCGANKYDASDVKQAIQRGQQYIDANTVAYAGSTSPAAKASGYPHHFVNTLFSPPPQGCSGQAAVEFPILTVNGAVRRVAAGPAPSKDAFGPGPDRVIFEYAGNGGALNYCGVATHSGAQGNSFVACTH